MMTAALYEMLCQAYSYVNSPAYRNKLGRRAGGPAKSAPSRSAIPAA